MVLSDDLRGAYGVGTWASALVGVGYDGVRWTAGAIWMIVMPKNRGRRIRKDVGGRYKIRTCDPFRVREVRYHCANRPGLRLADGLAPATERWVRESNSSIRLCRPLPNRLANPP